MKIPPYLLCVLLFFWIVTISGINVNFLFFLLDRKGAILYKQQVLIQGAAPQ